nr:MAG TPA: hypothetical protein [Caudoviricetes sp.]
MSIIHFFLSIKSRSERNNNCYKHYGKILRSDILFG